MGYLYGDSTPFPVEDNFLATLAALTETCVALLEVDADLEDARTLADETKAEAVKELSRLEALARYFDHASLVRGLESHMADKDSSHAAEVAVRVMVAARDVLEGARSENATRRDASLRDLEGTVAQRRAAILRVMETFLARHELPGTSWQLRWRAGAPGMPGLKDAAQAQAQVKASLPCGIDAIIELAIPLAHLWAKAPRVLELARKVTIRLPVEKRFLRKGGLRAERLDRWHLTEVDHGPDRQAFTLRRRLGAPSEGIEVVLRTADQDEPTARRVTAGGVAIGDTVALEAADTVAVKRLWRRVRATLDELRANRRRLVQGMSDGVALRDVVRPARVAEKLIETVAPLVREMRRRGATTTELVLKRDLGNGRREELFLPTEELTRRFPHLTPGRRALFDAFGLSEGVITGERGPVNGVVQQPIPAAAAQAIPHAIPHVIDRRLPGMPPPPPPGALSARRSEPGVAVPRVEIESSDDMDAADTQVETREFSGPVRAMAAVELHN